MKISFVTEALERSGQGLPAFELQNLYPATEGEQTQAFARQGPALVQPAGAVEWTDRGSSAIRGLFQYPGAAGSLLFCVTGTACEKIDAAKSATTVTGTVSGTDPLMFDMIRDTLLLNADGKVWHTTGTSLTQITDADLGTIGAIAAMDGRLIAARDASDTFVWSNIFDPGNIDALAFATAESYGDRLIRPVVYRRNLFLLGERSTEIWAPTGDNDQPFARIGGAVEDFGCPAKHSVAQNGPIIFFVAVASKDDAPFVAMMSPTAERISSPGVERLLASLSSANLAAIRGFSYRQNGAVFYQMDLPGVGTWVFHLESRTWWRRRKGTDTLWHSACYAHAYGKHLVGSSSADGKIYELDATSGTDAGDVMPRVATCYLPAERPTPISALVVDAKALGALAPVDALVVNVTGADVYVRTPGSLSITGSTYDRVRARFRCKQAATFTWDGNVFFTTASTTEGDNGGTTIAAPYGLSAGHWVIGEWDMSGKANWIGGTPTRVRIDLSNSGTNGDQWEIDWVEIVDANGDAEYRWDFQLSTESFSAVNATLSHAPGAFCSVELSPDDGANWRPARDVQIDRDGADGSGARAPLSMAWGVIRRPGALVRVTVESDVRLALYNLLVNEAST